MRTLGSIRISLCHMALLTSCAPVDHRVSNINPAHAPANAKDKEQQVQKNDVSEAYIRALPPVFCERSFSVLSRSINLFSIEYRMATGPADGLPRVLKAQQCHGQVNLFNLY